MKDKSKKSFDGLLIQVLGRPFSRQLTKVLVKTNITANQVTFISIFLALIASYFFSLGDYVSLIIGAIIFKIAYIFDLSDGELARHKNQASKFGAWFDDFGDRIRESTSIFALSIGLFSITENSFVLILGTIAVTNLFLVGYIKSPTLAKVQTEAEIKLFGYYLGWTETTVYITLLGIVLNQVYYVLWFFVIIGVLAWLKKFHSIYTSSRID